MSEETPPAESYSIGRIVLCVVLGVCLYLYITNNHLFTSGTYNWHYPETLLMLAVLGVPFGLAVINLIRSRRRAAPQHE